MCDGRLSGAMFGALWAREMCVVRVACRRVCLSGKGRAVSSLLTFTKQNYPGAYRRFAGSRFPGSGLKVLLPGRAFYFTLIEVGARCERERSARCFGVTTFFHFFDFLP